MSKLTESQYPAYFKPYVEILGTEVKSIVTHLESSLEKSLNLLSDASEEKQLYRYAEGKWTIKELVQHIIDSERVFGYRALTFARKDTTPLPGFDENNYVLHSNANDRGYKELLEELKLVRASTVLLFKSFGESDLISKGTASGKTISVNVLGYIISGHLLHHLKIIEDRYLI
ncbi:DinB family protein [Aureibaculum sp. 2210JD6-5]|uniref:DinB family protein n=1 Tax=Aureibaculum sp. 2210JD6-5 TaxID=3103957 RepID=UPI002AAE7239|nr:DinB family protein [Aureibaculum sp. 2210JD6-5]MDY7393928.1 DinB family protein [Aureibaculum sp. 2210JD6-5]